MTASKIILGAASSAAGGAGLDVDSLFSTYTYSGNGSTNSIVNNIDLSGEGGLVWLKDRGQNNHRIYDTTRGATNVLQPNLTAQSVGLNDGLTAFNSNGFTLGSSSTHNANNPENYPNFVSWTWRKAKNFFDVVTWTSNGSGSQRVNHNLGAVPGHIVMKRTDAAGPWLMSPLYSDGDRGYRQSSSTFGFDSTGYIGTKTSGLSSGFTATDFRPEYIDGYGTYTNINGATFVAYLFAHNDGDGDFGDGTQDIIKCGSFSHNASGAEVNLGFEPQWILFKATDESNNWYIFDAMRGIPTGGLSGDGDAGLFPNLDAAESVTTWGVDLTSTGFIVYGNNILSSGNAIYMAIRRPMAIPTSASEVFNVQEVSGSTNSTVTTGFPVDLIIDKVTNDSDTQSNIVIDRLRGIAKENEFRNNLLTYSSGGESSSANIVNGPSMTGYVRGSYWSGYTNVMFNWKRASNYFDLLQYTGTGTTNLLSHNLGVVPEMMWIKRRDGSKDWVVYHKDVGITKRLFLNSDARDDTDAGNTYYNSTLPTSTNVTVGGSPSNSGFTNGANDTYIMYLFASLDGISKIGSTTHTSGVDTNIDAGFSNGSRFVMIKRTDSSGPWYVFNSASGIVSGNDPYIRFNEKDAEITVTDYIDPLSSGFTLTENLTSGTYIYYAIA